MWWVPFWCSSGFGGCPTFPTNPVCGPHPLPSSLLLKTSIPSSPPHSYGTRPWSSGRGSWPFWEPFTDLFGILLPLLLVSVLWSRGSCSEIKPLDDWSLLYPMLFNQVFTVCFTYTCPVDGDILVNCWEAWLWDTAWPDHHPTSQPPLFLASGR